MNEEKKEATFFGKKEEDKPQKKGRGRPPKSVTEGHLSEVVCLKNFIHNGVSKKQGDNADRLSNQDVKHLQMHGLVGTREQLEEIRLAKKYGIRQPKVFPIDVNLD